MNFLLFSILCSVPDYKIYILVFLHQRDANIELDFTSKHNSFNFELSNNKYDGTVGIELTKTNLGKHKFFD